MITDTSSKFLEEGVYQFVVASYPSQVQAGQYMKWQFEFGLKGQGKPIKMSFFDNQLGELLRAVGCKEVKPNFFDWEADDVYNKKFEAELFFEKDRNGKINEKTGKVQTYRKLRNFRAVGQANTPEEIVWDE